MSWFNIHYCNYRLPGNLGSYWKLRKLLGTNLWLYVCLGRLRSGDCMCVCVCVCVCVCACKNVYVGNIGEIHQIW